MNEKIIKSMERNLELDIREYRNCQNPTLKSDILKRIIAQTKNLNEVKKIENETLKLNYDETHKRNEDSIKMKEKYSLEVARQEENSKNSKKEKKEEIYKYAKFGLEVVGAIAPLIVSIFMWYGQNRLIYIDDGRATPELKDVIKSVNKKIF